MTVFYTPEKSGVAGRNWWFKSTNENSLCALAKKSGLLEYITDWCKNTGRSIAVQGELIGEGIQGNKEKIKGHKFFIFDIWDIDAQQYVPMSQRHGFYTAMVAMNTDMKQYVAHVPVLDLAMKLGDDFKTIDDILAFADGPSYNRDTMREGVVFKSRDGAFSFKAISNKWLLTHGE
jgi:ATP-dependent RNA circularization protein (DNA/RNA ligase family)